MQRRCRIGAGLVQGRCRIGASRSASLAWAGRQLAVGTPAADTGLAASYTPSWLDCHCLPLAAMLVHVCCPLV